MPLSNVDLAALFGCEPQDVEASCAPLLRTLDVSCRRATPEERDGILVEVLRTLDGTTAVAGEQRKDDWQAGWAENLSDLHRSNFDTGTLVPKYVRTGEYVRLFQDAWIASPTFVADYTEVFRSWLFRRYLSQVDAVYEFGCGSGQHLSYLATAFPGIKLVGLDWVQSSTDIIDALRDQFGWDINGRIFDFFSPDHEFKMQPGAAVLTFGALEQVGKRWGPFLEYLLSQQPRVCLHVEPILELYDERKLFDYLAARYHRKRGYLDGFLTELRRLDAAGTIRIEREWRHRFGTRFNETYSYVVWSPRR